MNVADIAIARPPELRPVGIRFDGRIHVMDTAIRLYRDLGIAADIQDTTISIMVPRAAAGFYMGMIERYTGRVAYNDWEKP